MQHQHIDIKPYMYEILTLADGAIEAVIWGKIVKDGKVKAGDHEAIDMLHHQIELELASTWQKASAKRTHEIFYESGHRELMLRFGSAWENMKDYYNRPKEAQNT